jgi:hypothetical protein
VENILNRLVEAKAIDSRIDVGFWARTHVNTTYGFSGRFVLGIGDMHPQFKGKSMEAMLRAMYEHIFEVYGTKKSVYKYCHELRETAFS